MPPFPSLMTCRRDGFGVPPVFLYFLSNCFRGGLDTAFIMRTEGLNNPSRRRRKPDLSMTGTEEVDMRKKGLAAVAALVLGAVVFFVTVFSSPASAKGYEVYQTALEKTKEARGLTADVDVLITDNGAKLMTGRATVKLNKEMKAGSVEATFRDESGDGSKPFSRQVYWQDGKVILKEGDECISVDGTSEGRKGKGGASRPAQGGGYRRECPDAFAAG